MISAISKAVLGASTRQLNDSENLKIGLISDLHLNLNYNENYGPRLNDEGDCWTTSGTFTDVKAPMGRYGCDPPAELIDTMLDAFNDYHGD